MARTKSVAFFHLMYDNPTPEILDTDWRPFLASVAGLSDDQRTIHAKHAVFFVEVVDADRGHLLVHRVKDLDEWLKIRGEGGVRDLRDEIEGDVLETSAVAIQRRNSVFALVRGSVAAPGHGQVAYVLSQLTGGHRLFASAITVRAQLDRLAAAQGMTRFSLRVSGDSTWTPPNHGVMRTMRELREATGPEVTVGIEVSVGHKRNHELLHRVAEFVGTNLGILPEDSRGEAAIINEEGDREVINLVEHKLAMTVELPDQGLVIEHMFGTMDAFAASHAGEIRRSLAIVEGADQEE